MKKNNDANRKKNETPKYSKKRCIIAQWLVALILGFYNINIGMIFSIPTVVIGGLLKEKELFHINLFEASWFGSIPYFTMFVGSILAGFLQKLIGLKGTMVFSHMSTIIGLALLYYTDSIPILYTSAAVMGLSAGFSQAPVLSYSGEIFQPELRGTLSSIGGIFFNVGYTVAFLLGAIYKWENAVILCIICPILTFLMMLMIPESPVWLAQKRKMKKGKAGLCWLRGWTKEEYILDEWNAIIHHINMKNNKQAVQLYSSENKQISQNILVDKPSNIAKERKSKSFNKFKSFFSPSVQKPLLLVTIYFVGSFCVCLIPMRPVLIEILNEMNISIDPYWFMVVSSVLQVLGAIAFSAALIPFGKRLITVLSFSASILTCYGLFLYISLGIHIAWIPLVLFSINSFMSTFGVVSIPWILIAEIFPLEFRRVASGVSVALCYIMIFLTTKTYVNAKLFFGVSGAIFMYGTVGLSALIYLYFKLPETEGRTLRDIESSFNKKKECSVFNCDSLKIEELQHI